MAVYIFPPGSWKLSVYQRAQKERPRQHGEVIYVFKSIYGDVYGFTKPQITRVAELVNEATFRG